LPVFEAADLLAQRGQSAVILAGERYGMGSSRDCAAKGVALLGARAMIARSFERIHRTNLIGMGILPLQIEDGFDPQNAGISAADTFEIDARVTQVSIVSDISVRLVRSDGSVVLILCRAALEIQQCERYVNCDF